jgi:hypothetical protein
MSAAATTPNKAEAPPEALASPRWLLLGLTLLLAALAVFQLVYLAPICMYVVQHLEGHLVPAPLLVLMRIPEWAGLIAGLMLAAFAVWQRGSLHRLSLLAIVALAVNLGLLLAILSSLFQVLSRFGR